MTYELRFDYPRPPLAMNQRLHHMARARITRDIREATALIGRNLPPMDRCEVSLTWYVTDNRRRDADNVVPTLKAMCDELVAIGVVCDDTPQYMSKTMPVIARTTESQAHMILRISALEAEDA